MARLVWDLNVNGYEARAIGADSGAEYQIEEGQNGDYLLFVDDVPLPFDFGSVAEAQTEAEAIEARDEDPNNTFRGDFAGFAENH